MSLGARPLSREIVFPGSRVAVLPPPPDLEPWLLAARDGAPVHALSIPGPEDAKVFVYFHDNRQTMVHGVALGRELRRRGFGVVLAEYRGYGLSRGQDPSEEGLYWDAEAVLDGLAERRVGPERIILWGSSLGTGVAAEMARRGRGGALVLIAPYTSLPDVATASVPLLPARWLMPDTFDTLAKSHEIRVPTLVVHGDRDDVIPCWMGREIARAIPGARFVSIAGGGHGDLFVRDHDGVLRAMSALAHRG